MPEEYDRIADAYKNSKKLSFRTEIEEFTLFKILGDVAYKSVVDLACGEGYYTRKLKNAGAKTVLGIDISSEMIELAKKQEQEYPLGCKYLNQDVSKLSISQQFDVVTAMYLLNYASNKELLLRFCTTAYKMLKQGGVFVGFNDNIALNPNHAPSFSKYGFEKSTPLSQKEGDTIIYTITNDDSTTFSINNFYLKPDTYEWAFKKAGFSSFSWEGPFLNPSQKNNPFWNEFMEYKPVIGFKALK